MPAGRIAFDFEARVYTTHRIDAVLATLAEDGIASRRVLEGSGLDPAMLLAPATRVSFAQIAQVFRNALRLSPDPTVALRAGSRMRVTSYGVYGYALLSSPTAAGMADFAVSYQRIATPGVELSFEHEGKHAVFRYKVLLTPDPDDALYRFTLEFSFAAHLALSRELHDSNYDFAAVRATFPVPGHVSAYRMLFRCPVAFGQDCNEIQIDPSRLEQPPRLPDACTHEMAREMCQQMLAGMRSPDGMAAMVRRALVEQMPWRFPNLESMAREMALPPRTLRRRLEAQGTSYSEILVDVRRALAIDYLRATRMTCEDIATRLGYSDAANFRHAFVRWTGKAPHSYRKG